MAAAKIIVVEKNEGEKIAYDVSTTKIIFGDDDLMVNIKNRERDEEVTLAKPVRKDYKLRIYEFWITARKRAGRSGGIGQARQ